jgi:hypothetical protein
MPQIKRDTREKTNWNFDSLDVELIRTIEILDDPMADKDPADRLTFGQRDASRATHPIQWEMPGG